MTWLIHAAQITTALLALKAIVWGCGGPTLRGWNNVVPRDRP